MGRFFKNKLTSIANHFLTQKNTFGTLGLNTLPDELKFEILNKLDYPSLQAMACVSHYWEKFSHSIPYYHSKEYYAYSGNCDAGMIRNKTIDIHWGNYGGSGPVFVPSPRVNIDFYRLSNPSANEFLKAFVHENRNNYPFEIFRDKPGPRERGDRQFPIFKIKLKRTFNPAALNTNKIKCTLSDVQQIFSGEFTWYPKHFGLFEAKPRFIQRKLKNQFAPEIEAARSKTFKK